MFKRAISESKKDNSQDNKENLGSVSPEITIDEVETLYGETVNKKPIVKEPSLLAVKELKQPNISDINKKRKADEIEKKKHKLDGTLEEYLQSILGEKTSYLFLVRNGSFNSKEAEFMIFHPKGTSGYIKSDAEDMQRLLITKGLKTARFNRHDKDHVDYATSYSVGVPVELLEESRQKEIDAEKNTSNSKKARTV